MRLLPEAIRAASSSPAPMTRAVGAPILSVRQLTRRYGGLAAVAEVDLDVARDDLLGIIGPNGAGKTTLFNLMSGFEQPTTGTVSLDGKRIDGMRAHRIARLGMSRTFQNLRIAPGLSVFDNVTAGAIGQVGFPPWCAFLPASVNRRGAAIEQRSWRALERVGLADDAERTAGSLSYGKRKYLEIARALAAQPRLLILDEPAAGLNDTESLELAAFIRGLHAEGITVMLVEHDMKLVMSTCTRVVVLAAGRKIAEGTPAEVCADPVVQEAYLGSDLDD